MSNYFEEKQEKAVKKAVEKAEKKAEKKNQEAKENFVLNLISLGKLTFEEIAKCSGLTLQKVQMLANSL